MAYPVLPQSLNSAEQRLNGRQLDRATNGTPKLRSFYTSGKKVFPIVHEGITAAEKATHEAYYAANLNNSFEFVWNGDGATYTVWFGEKDPVYKPLGGGHWTITVEMVQA